MEQGGNSGDFTARARARARALAQDFDAVRRRAGLSFSAGATVQRLRDALQELLAVEAAPGRLLPWLPVAFGAGLVLYFTASHEPAAWATGGLAIACIAIAIAARHHAVGFALALAVAAAALGFAAATLKTVSIAHPILHVPATVELNGFVEIREERDKSDRKPIPAPPIVSIRSSHEIFAEQAEEAIRDLETKHFPARGTPVGDDLWDKIEGRSPIEPGLQEAVERKLKQFHSDKAWVKRLMDGDPETTRQWQIACGLLTACTIPR